MTTKDSYQLFMSALDTVNRSLEANRGKGAYGKLIEGFDEYADGHVAAVAVYEDDPATPFDYFTLRYLKGRFELLERGKGGHDTEWKVSREYLQSLVGNPQRYIDHPERMDLDWLRTALPDKIASLFDKVA